MVKWVGLLWLNELMGELLVLQVSGNYQGGKHSIPSMYIRATVCTRNKQLSTCYKQLATCYKQLATCYKQLATCYKQLATCYKQLTTWYEQLTRCSDAWKN